MVVGLFAPILLCVTGGLLSTAIVLSAPPHEFAAPVVVAGSEGFKLPGQGGQTVPYVEGGAVSDALAGEVRAFPEVGSVEPYEEPTSGAVVALGVRPRSGTSSAQLADQLRTGVGADIQVLTGDERGFAEDPAIQASRLPLLVVGAVTTGVMIIIVGLVASAALGLTINERRREIRMLRLAGATPRQVRRLLVVETMLIALVSATLGALAAPLVSARCLDALRDAGLLPPLLVPTGQWPTALAAGAITVAALSISASLIAGPAVRRAAEPDQSDLESREFSPLRRSLALAVGGTAAAMLLATPFLGPEGGSSVGGPAILVAVAAVGLGAPVLIWSALPLMRLWGAKFGFRQLATDEVAARTRRFGAIVTMVALGVALAVGNISAAFTSAAAEHPQLLRASAFVDIDDAGDADVQRAAAAAAGREGSVSATTSSSGWIEAPYDGTGTDPLPLTGVNHAADFVVPKVSSGSLDDLRGDTIAVTKSDAEHLNIDVGDTVTYRFGDGASERLRVVAVLDADRSMRARVVPFDTLAAHVRPPASTLVIRTDVSPSHLTDALGGLGAHVRTSAPTVSSGDVAGSLGSLIYLAVGIAALAFATLVAMNSLIALTMARRAELWAWRLVGASRRQIVAALFGESTFVVMLGTAAGCAIGAAAATAIALGLGRAPAMPLRDACLVLTVPALLVLAAGTIAGLRATHPAEAS